MPIRPDLTYSLLCPEVVQCNLHIFLKEQHLAQENQKTAVSEQEHGEMLFFFFFSLEVWGKMTMFMGLFSNITSKFASGMPLSSVCM